MSNMPTSTPSIKISMAHFMFSWLCNFFLATPHGIWDLCSPAKVKVARSSLNFWVNSARRDPAERQAENDNLG